MRMGRRQYQKGEKTMTIQQHNTAALTGSQEAQTMTIHRERRSPIGRVSSTLRGVALAGMALFLVGCSGPGCADAAAAPKSSAGSQSTSYELCMINSCRETVAQCYPRDWDTAGPANRAQEPPHKKGEIFAHFENRAS